MTVKGNQPGTNKISIAFDAPENEHLAKRPARHDKGHGRYETRVFCVLSRSILEPETAGKWPDRKNGSIAQVAITRLDGTTGNKSIDTRCFISSPG